jgi:hypothetical protein
LKILIENLSWRYNIQADHIFDEINATLLQAIVPEQECFNDQCVEDILINELENFINNRTNKLDMSTHQVFNHRKEKSTTQDPFPMHYTQSKSHSGIIDCRPMDTMMVDQHGVDNSASESLISNFTWNLSHEGSSFASENKIYDSYENEGEYNYLERMLQFEVVGTRISLNNEIYSLSEDLPAEFSETELECLVASLDRVSDGAEG